MPYTNPDQTPAYLIDGMDSGGMLIANSTEAITGDVYAQQLTFSGSGGVLSDCTISAGGTITMGTSTTISGVNQTIKIYNGGSMMLSSGASLRNFELYDGAFVSGKGATKLVSGTVGSGASVMYNGNSLYGVTIQSGGYVSTYTGLYISSATLESGATLAYGGAVRFVGKENNIAKGTLNSRAAAYTSGGVLYDYNTRGGATHFTNIVVSNLTLSATTYASSRAVLRDVRFVGSAFLMVFSSGAVYNLDATGNKNATLKLYYGNSATLSAAVTLGGTKTTVRQGGIQYLAGTYTSYTADPDIYIENGVVYSMSLMAKKEGKSFWLNRINLESGMSAQAPVISSRSEERRVGKEC